MKDESSAFFADAIFNSAKKKDKKFIETLSEDLKTFENILTSEEKIGLFLNHPSIPYSKKSEFIEKIISNELACRLIKLLVKLKKTHALSEITTLFSNLIRIESNYIDAEITLPFEIEDKIEAELEKALFVRFGKKVNIIKKINPEIIGGIQLKIENTVYDYTVLTQLNSFKERFNIK